LRGVSGLSLWLGLTMKNTLEKLSLSKFKALKKSEIIKLVGGYQLVDGPSKTFKDTGEPGDCDVECID
jgi:hypothetical protein